MDGYVAVLKDNGLKITPKRKAVIELFLKKKKRMHPYEVLAGIKNLLPSVGLPTIYRILDEFKKVGILIQVFSDDCQLYYSLCSMPEAHHHHFLCRKCKKIEEVDYCNFKELSKFIEKKHNCKVESHLLQIEGLCGKCKK